MIQRFLSLFCACICLFSCKLVYSQQSLSDTIDLYPVTVIAIHPGTDKTESLVLDYQDKLAHDGGALLNHVASISTIRKGGSYGFDPVFRGFKYDQLNLVLNGAQTASAACPNRMDPPTSQMAPNMIRKIEILKGPYALRYGNAFGATINFQSAPPQFTETKEGYGRFSGSYNSNGDIFRTEVLAGLSAKRVNLGLFAAWSQGNDYLSGEDHLIPADFMRTSFGARLGIRISESQLLKLSATRNLARDTDFASLPMDLRSDDTWMFSAAHDFYPSGGNLKSWHTTLYGSYVDHLMDNFDKELDPRPVNASTWANTLNVGGRTEGAWSFSQSRLFSGADYRYEGAEGERTREFLMGPNAGNEVFDNVWQGGKIQRAGIFAEYHLRGASIKWIISGRVNLNHADITDPDPGFSDLYTETQSSQVNPAISIGATKQFTEKLSFGAWLGRVQRSGSLTERFINYFPVGVDPYEMLGNPMLSSEINNQADLSLQWRTDQTSISLDLFVAYLQDPISSVIDTSLNPRMPGSPGVRQYININRAMTTGFEASWNQLLPFGMQHNLSMAYTYGQDLERKDPLPEIAPLDTRFQLSGSYFSHRLKPYLTFRYVIEQARISTEFGETITPAFALMDLGTSFRFKRVMVFSAGIQNLFDTLYYEHLSRSVRNAEATPIYSPGRCFFLSFSLDLM
ncbi:MAG: TonB-dependent receptor [Bacteroidota bacterium]|nr:TonB-dependent receptor [Bacteroidota bacterium]